MIRKLLASTAIATVVATGAYAQTTTSEPAQAPVMEMEQQQIDRAAGHLASNIIGENVYNSVADDAENIGSVNDIVIGTHGGVDYIIIGVGGFLGIGQRDVAVPFEQVEWADRDGQWWLVVNTTREALEAQPEFETAAYDPALGLPPRSDRDMAAAPADDTMADDDMAAAPVNDGMTDDDMAAVPADDTEAVEDVTEAPIDDELMQDEVAAAPADDTMVDDEVATAPVETEVETDRMETAAIDRASLDTVDTTAISADDLIGTTVYGANDENVGSVGDVILSQDGNVDAIIIDVGGFLGIGTKEVAVGFENLEFMRDADGSMYLYTQFTEEQLDAQPAYDDTTYTDQRDDQRLIYQR